MMAILELLKKYLNRGTVYRGPVRFHDKDKNELVIVGLRDAFNEATGKYEMDVYLRPAVEVGKL